ncbi:MAG: DNA-binding protein [Deltaproteobacteria bacterium]|jgi:hypothetical protein
MNANKKMKYFCSGLVLAFSLFLWNSPQVSASPQHRGVTMKTVSGKVVQTMNSGGYTYALVEKDGVKTWVAMPVTKIAVGNEINCRPGMVMNNFRASSLKRTFEHIVFSQGLAPAAGAAAPAPAEAVKVSKAEAPDAHTISEIYEQKGSLANKPVTVQAKVVKVTHGIMGKNWLHLQDGTGSSAAGTNELVVTTDSDSPKVGDVVIIKGNLSTDRDFGSGYKYSVIVEGAEVAGNK